ncbi:MAG TPA: flagellar export protein FliJ [Spirochaetia bacterium]|nr:flagellar export protein FliJ [Spirochaetia bacterium]
MKRFQFRLERLLKVREYAERQLEIRVADATRVCLDLTGRIDALAAERAETAMERGSDSAESAERSSLLDMATLVARDRYMVLIDRKTEELSMELAIRDQERETIREKLAEASRARKVLDKLKERKNDEYYHEIQRHANSVIDELGGSGVIRKRQKGER